ncbi:unnamed protein product, partial [Mesorhabditis spiculigera]
MTQTTQLATPTRKPTSPEARAAVVEKMKCLLGVFYSPSDLAPKSSDNSRAPQPAPPRNDPASAALLTKLREMQAGLRKKPRADLPLAQVSVAPEVLNAEPPCPRTDLRLNARYCTPNSQLVLLDLLREQLQRIQTARPALPMQFPEPLHSITAPPSSPALGAGNDSAETKASDEAVFWPNEYSACKIIDAPPPSPARLQLNGVNRLGHPVEPTNVSSHSIGTISDWPWPLSFTLRSESDTDDERDSLSSSSRHSCVCCSPNQWADSCSNMPSSPSAHSIESDSASPVPPMTPDSDDSWVTVSTLSARHLADEPCDCNICSGLTDTGYSSSTTSDASASSLSRSSSPCRCGGTITINSSRSTVTDLEASHLEAPVFFEAASPARLASRTYSEGVCDCTHCNAARLNTCTRSCCTTEEMFEPLIAQPSVSCRPSETASTVESEVRSILNQVVSDVVLETKEQTDDQLWSDLTEPGPPPQLSERPEDIKEDMRKLLEYKLASWNYFERMCAERVRSATAALASIDSDC